MQTSKNVLSNIYAALGETSRKFNSTAYNIDSNALLKYLPAQVWIVSMPQLEDLCVQFLAQLENGHHPIHQPFDSPQTIEASVC